MRARLAVAAVVLVSLATNVVGLDWGLPNAFSWSNDDPTPRRALNVPRTYREGWDVYPYLQLWIDYAAYVPYVRALESEGLVDRTCPELDADCFVRPHDDLGRLQWLSRAIAALMGATLSVAVFAATRRVGGSVAAGLIGALAVASSQVVVFFSHVGNVDVPATFWFAWSLYALVRVARGGGWRDHVALGALAGCALATKESVYGAYVLPMAALSAIALREPRRRVPQMAAMAVVAVGVYAAANNVWGNPAGFLARLAYWSSGPGVDPWNDAYGGAAPFLGEVALQTAQAMGGPLLAFAAAGAVVSLSDWRRTWPLGLALVSYVAFTLLPIRYSFVRFTLPMVVVLAAHAGLLGGYLVAHRAATVRRIGATVTALVLLAAYAGSLQVDYLLVHDARYAAEAWLRAHVPPTARIEVLGSKTHLPRLSYLGYAFERIPEDAFHVAALALRDHEYLLLSSRSFEKLSETDPDLLRDLLAGRAGYDVAFDAQTLPPIPWILGTVFVEPRTNPRIIILVRRAPRPERMLD